MRLNKTVVVERENFVRDLFTNNPGLSGNEVQSKVVERFGRMMRPNRIFEIKRQVAQTVVDSAAQVVQTETTEAVPF